MPEGIHEDKMLQLFDSLLLTLESSKDFREEDISSGLIFDLQKMWKSSSSRVFSQSAVWIEPDIATSFLEKGLVQKISFEDGEKFALTYKGIAHCIKAKYHVALEDQFLKFLELADEGFNTQAQNPLTWREKLASLSLILLAGTSESAAIRMANETNKIALMEVFQKTLSCLRKLNVIVGKEELKTVKRGENPAAAVMSRIDTLARKTRQYYRYTGHSEYFLEIEKDNEIDENKLFFLLGKIFERYDPECNYREAYKELANISQVYYPRFLARTVSSTIVLSVLKKLRKFFEEEIIELPHVIRPMNGDAASCEQQLSKTQKGKFWPAVRVRMYEKAMQLYMKDHQDNKIKPEMKDLRKGGYMQRAKTLVLQDMQREKKNA